jgi:16S rRNA (adenine1518-N6/adenine1519-N6)-dimethyltransferase
MMTSIYGLLKQYNIRPKKGLGQNFLADANHLAKIVAAAELQPDDVVLEIGPGLGALSLPLAQTAKAVVAVELDAVMVEILQTELAYLTNFKALHADILTVDPVQVIAANCADFQPGQPYQVVANLPYYITSAVIRQLLEAAYPPQKIIITVQKEVAQRVVAQPGKMSILAVAVQFYGQPTLCHTIPASAFVPSPKIDSAVLRIDCYKQPPVVVTNQKRFFQVVRAGFGQKRKQLKNSLAAGLHLSQSEVAVQMAQVGIDPTRRAETLSLAEWGVLAAVFT